MSKLKININKQNPPSHVIQKYKEANDFMHVYKKLHKPSGIREMFLKDKKKLSMIVVFLMLLLIWVLGDETKNTENEKPKIKIELKE